MKYLFYFLLLFFITVNAQTSDKGEVTYLDFNQKPTSKENAIYYEFRIPYKKDIIKYQKYFIYSATKAYLVEKYYLDKEGNKQGKYKSFYNEGQIKREGVYLNNIKNGLWKYYLVLNIGRTDSIINQSSLTDIESYKNGLKEGGFKEYYFDGKIKGEGQYKNDNFIGECKWYHPNGQISSLEFYNEKGKLKTIQQWDEKGAESHKRLKSNLDLKANIKIVGINISRHITYEINKSLYKKHPYQRGKVYIQFLLDKNGKANVLKIKRTNGISLEYEKELKKVLKRIPIQKPIYYHNLLIPVKFTIPIVIVSKNDIKYKNDPNIKNNWPYTKN